MQYSQKSFCAGVSFGISPLILQLHQKENPTQVFSCEYSEIFKNTSFEKHLPTAASNDQVRINVEKKTEWVRMLIFASFFSHVNQENLFLLLSTLFSNICRAFFNAILPDWNSFYYCGISNKSQHTISRVFLCFRVIPFFIITFQRIIRLIIG